MFALTLTNDLLSPRQWVPPAHAKKYGRSDQLRIGPQLHLRPASPTHERLFRSCWVRLRALYLALGLEPIVKIVTVGPSTLLVKFVGALLNLLLNRDQDGRLILLWCECRLGRGSVHVVAGSFPFLDLVWTAIYHFFQLFSWALQFVGFGAFLCHTHTA